MAMTWESWYAKCPQEAREILGQTGVDAPSEIYYFENLSVEKLSRLIGAVEPDGRQNGSPSAAEMLKFGENNPGTLFSGYRVSDDRFDRRISLETMHIPIKESVSASEFEPRLLEVMQTADECDGIDGMLRLWWD